jgi:O-antigen/teichoic acid export membrane protein
MNKALMGLLAIKVYGAFASYLLIVVLRDYLGPVDADVLSFTIACMIMSSVLFIFGQNIAIFGVDAKYAEANKVSLYGLSLTLVVVASLLGVAGLIYLSDLDLSFDIRARVYLLCSLYVVSEAFGIFLRNEDNFLLSLLPRELIWRSACFLYVVSQVNASILDVLNFFIVTLLMVVVIQAVSLAVSIRSKTGKGQKRLKGFSLSKYYLLSQSSFFVAFLGVVNLQAITFLAYRVYGNDIASGYFIAERTSNLLVFILTASCLYFGPKFSKAEKKVERQSILDQSSLLGLLSSLLFLAVFFIFLFFGCFGISGICSVNNTLYFVILLSQVPNVLSGMVAYSLQTLGSVGVYLKLLFLVNMTTAGLQLIASRYFEIEILALLAFLGSIVMNFSALYLLWARHGYRADVFHSSFKLLLKGVRR